MFWIIGIFRRTALWAIFLTVLGTISTGNPEMLRMLLTFGIGYLFLVFIHLLACKLGKSRRSSGEVYLSTLGHDMVAPFEALGTFLAVITKKWIIQDDSKFHNFIDGVQVVVDGIWSIIIWGIAIFFIVNMI